MVEMEQYRIMVKKGFAEVAEQFLLLIFIRLLVVMVVTAVTVVTLDKMETMG